MITITIVIAVTIIIVTLQKYASVYSEIELVRNVNN